MFRHWVMSQTWDQLLFAHWPLPAARLAALVAAPLEVDTFDGQAWLGVVAFRLSRIQLRGCPVVSAVSDFAEVNLRTYVRIGGKPGVLFLSLHCPNRLAMALARPWFRLPYRHSRVALDVVSETAHFSSQRQDGVDFAAVYRPTLAPVGGLERWLSERYCYYVQTPSAAVYRCDIAHQPWALARAEAHITRNTLGVPFGLAMQGQPLVHYAAHMDTRIWPIRRVA
jgi:uncharacterized protein YqjF (DUF2071 family)